MTQEIDLLVTGLVVTMNANFDIFPAGAVAIDQGKIVAVGQAADLSGRYQPRETRHYHTQAVIPGLVNAHTHVPMTLLRGLNDDLRLDVWLGYLMPLEREFVTPEFVRLGTAVACAEMIRSGITTFADMYYFEDDIAEETAAAGMRALLGQTLLVFPAPDAESYEDSLALCRQFIEKWQGHALIQPAVAPHAWYTATPELLRACADLARAYDVPLHTHISESALEVENCRRDHNMPVVPWNARHGLLETKLLAAHCVHLDQGEIYDLHKAGAGVAHCPTSNLKLASGIAPVGQMLEVGLKLGVGTDGPASNNDLDMFEEMRLAALLAKAQSNDPTVLPARQAFELATISGARAVYLDHLAGSLEAGKRADFAVVNMGDIHNWPHFHNNPDAVYSRLVYAAKSSDVVDVMCNGRWLMQERQLLTIDEARIKKEAAEVAARIDAFVLEREASVFNKLVLLAGIERQESFEVQVKAVLDNPDHILSVLRSAKIKIVRSAHYYQYDSYFLFANDPEADRLRYREDEFVNEAGEVYQARSRLTLLSPAHERAFDNAVMLSRSRYLAPATQSLRFYREYFAPAEEIKIHKDRLRWHIIYKETDFAINLDKPKKPELPAHYLEIKSRTWSRQDAERKVGLIAELLELFAVDLSRLEELEYLGMAR